MKACNQCGKCCIKYSDGGLSASSEEIAYWEAHKPEIFSYVANGEIWVSPETGKPLELCPWLRKELGAFGGMVKYTCDVYEDRPDDCRYYPVSIDDMLRDECEMIEPKDLLNTKQAQKRLDLLMIEDRPPLEG